MLSATNNSRKEPVLSVVFHSELWHHLSLLVNWQPY